MDQIFIRDLLAHGVIGISEQERQKKQDILINITLYIDLHAPGESDDINDTVSYSDVARKAKALAESAQRYTVEALASDLASMCLAEPGVQSVIVRVEKPGVVDFTRSVGVEIERTRLSDGSDHPT
jgi:FolB domain-containing protein